MLEALGFRLRGIRTFALVGKSGTGKSFRARLVAEKRGIDLIIDDGLIIRGGTILCGSSAKKESSLISAVRRALFDEPVLATEARRVLRRERYRGVLVVATSAEMVEKIVRNLELPPPKETLRITEVASPAEMNVADRARRRRGSHSLPLPPVSVRLGIRGAIGGRVRAMRLRMQSLRKQQARPPITELTTGSPGHGQVVFTEAAMGQMVQHCVQEFDPGLSLNKLTISYRGALYSFEARLGIPFGRIPSGRLHEMREYLIHSLEKHAGILVEEVTLIVENVRDGGPR